MAEIYRQEDAQQILNLAIARQTEASELSRVQLYEIAAELNISPADLEAAEQEWLTHQDELSEKRIFDQYRHGKFRQSLAKYLIVNAALVLLDLFTGGGFRLSWSLYIVLFWGVAVALEAWQTYQLSPEDYENAFRRWRQRRQLKRSVSSFVNRLVNGV
jgi:hypothetical protein